MFSINKEDMSIYATRGDVVFFSVKAYDGEEAHTFNAGDVVRMKIYEKKNCDKVVLSKSFGVVADTLSVEIFLNKTDTRFGEGINKPVEYWYEIELNPDTDAQTIIGYDDDGAKIFKLFPEGADAQPVLPSPDEAGFSIDAELSLTSTNPVQNRAVASAMRRLENYINEYTQNSNENTEVLVTAFGELKAAYEAFNADLETVKKIATEAAEAVVGKSVDDALAAHNGDEDAHGGMFAKAPVTFTADIFAVAWSEDNTNGGYLVRADVEGLLGTDNPIVDIVLGENVTENKEALEAWSHVTRITTDDGEVVLWANETLPEADFTIQIKVVR